MCAMSASVEDSMDVDEENNMQVDEDNATGELPMSTDEDSVQDTGGAMKVTDIPMVSDCTDVDISEGPRAESDGPTEMESDNLTEEVGNLSSVKFGDKSGEDTGLQETVEPVLESGADTLRDDGSPLCHTTIEQTVSSSNVSEAAEEHVGETETNPERASTTNVDSHIVEKNNPGDDGSLSGENEAEQEQMVENTVGNDETSQNNGGDDQDPLNSEQDSRNDVDSGENSNVTSVSATEENARDSFAQDGDGSSNAAPEQLMTAPHEDSIPASDDGESSSSSANDNKGVGEGKSVDEELSEQLELVQPMTAPDEDSAPASDVGESCSNIGNDNKDMGEGKSLAEELSEQLELVQRVTAPDEDSAPASDVGESCSNIGNDNKDMGEGKSLAEELSEHVDLVQRVTAPDEDSAPASDVGEPNSNIDNDNRDMGEGKSLAEELREQVDLVQQMAVPDEDSAAASDLGESSSNIGNDNKDVGEGKSLAEELNEKPADDDHISIDDASSVGGVDAENADHVSIDGSSEGERVVDHVSVDSDSDIEDTISDVKASSSTKTSNGRNDDGSVAHTVPVDDEVEETAGVDNDSEKPADGDPTQLMIDVASAVEAADASIQDEDKASNGTQKTNTVDLVDSDDDSALPTSSFSIRPRSSESLRGHITLIGKAADTETIISDDPVSTRSATVVVLDAPKPATPSQNSSNADPSTHSSVPSDSARAMKTVYSVKKIGTPTQWKCLQCSTYQRCPWKVTIGASSQYICSDKCLEAHRVQRRQIIESGGPPATHIIQIADVSNLKKKCALCAAYIPKNKVGCLTWEVMNFCDEDCLSKHQAAFTSHCCNCEAVVTTSSMGKYCVRFGHEVKQFCTPLCLDTYKKGIKTCSYCQKNLQDSSEGFLAAVGGKDQFRDFCSQDCLEKYDCICNNSSHAYSVANCIVCDNVKVTQFELLSTSKVAKLCSDVCLAAYKFVNNIEVGICGMCNKYYDTLGVDECVTFNNDIPSTFCSKHCMNINVISKRKIVPCAWCKAKKYNFDMVYRRGANDDESLFVCSVNCLALHSVSLKALPPKKVNCSYCKKLDVSTYHITMSDASVRHFCSYDCVLSFQSAFNVPVLNANIPVPEGAAKKIVRPADATVSSPTSTLAMPTIQSVGTLKAIDPINPPALVPQSTPANKVKHTTLKIPASFCSKPPEMRNRWTQISVCRSTKCVSCKPKKEEKDVQCDLVVEPVNGETSSMTDSAKENGNVGTSQTKAVIPIPVPIYVPHPMAMFTLPTPIAIPIPVPIIVPIIIPTSLENMDRVIDTMKEILEKSMRENQSSTMGQSSAIDEVLQMVRSGTDSGGEGKKRVMDHGDSDEDLVPPKRARLAEDKSCSDTSETQANMKLKFMLGPNTWKHFAKNWNESLGDNDEPLKLDILAMRPRELSSALAVFVREARKANGDEYRPDLKFYLCLGIQYYLFENSRVDDIFGDTTYEEFTDALDVEARKFNSSINSMVSRVEEEHLWESMQLGAKSPQVLLLTLMYFITLRFNLWTLEEHMQLSFNTFSKEIKSSSSDKAQGGKVIRLVLNSSSGNMSDGAELKKQREFEFTENKKDIMRCPVRLYEFYITKCPENIKTHSDRFYLMPETSCLPESPVWYRSLALPPQMLEKMLNRVKMIKEVRESMSGQYGPTDQETC